MSEDLINELAAVWTQLRAAIARIDQLEAANARVERGEIELVHNSKPWEPWTPEIGEKYWTLSDAGYACEVRWDAHYVDIARRDRNNCFRTKEAAERYVLRLRSMRPTCPVPKVGEGYYTILFDDSVLGMPIHVSSERIWNGGQLNCLLYNRGLVFQTREACADWIAEFGDAWTTLEGDPQ